MRAAYLEKNGGPEVLQVGEVSTPEPTATEVLVRVKFAALNHLDLWVRRGLPGSKLKYPHVLGADAAGVVVKVGALVEGVKTGDEVIVHPGVSCLRCPACLSGWETLCRHYGILGEHRWGTNAEFVCVPAANIFPKPASITFAEAAAIGLVFVTAWQMLVRRAQVRLGQWVLIHAAGSGVSSAAIQIARLFGAEVVATAGSREKLALAAKLGAQHVIAYREQDFLAETKKLRREGMDIVLDHVGKDLWEKNLRALRWGGTLVTCGATSGPEVMTDLRQVFFRQLQILGSTMGSKADFPLILAQVAAGTLRAVVDKQFPLAGIQEAHRYLESRGQFGKVLLAFDSDPD